MNNRFAKISGIKFVDIYAKASGRGIVNQNGNILNLWDSNGNYVIPKLRNLSLMKRLENGELRPVQPQEITNETHQLYVSQNCLRKNLFVDHEWKGPQGSSEYIFDIFASPIGLLRGYLITKKGSQSFRRKSPLAVGDFDEQNRNLSHEVNTNSFNDKTGGYIFRITAGATDYSGHIRVSVEDLQFLPIDNVYMRSCLPESALEIANGTVRLSQQGQKAKEDLEQMLREFSAARNLGLESDVATSAGFYHRKGSSTGCEFGILLNQAAITVAVEMVLDMVRDLYIQNARGLLYVDKVEVDYNDSTALRASGRRVERGSLNWAEYYESAADRDLEIHQRLSSQQDELEAEQNAKQAEAAEKKTKAKAKKRPIE